jgi:glycosyltransferase involved in cell wall biosynthesis
MSGVRISIVIPNHNSGEALERAIQSLLAQNYPNLELIAADAVSTDVSREILERHRQAFLTLLVEEDEGQADGLNKGFARAHGDVHGWLCADDELLAGALQHVAELFAQRPDADVVIGACERVFPDGSTRIIPSRADTWDIIGIQNVVDQPSVFWRADLHRRIGPIDTSYDLAFDWDFWCRMRDAGARLITTDRILSRYHFSATNKSGTAGRRHARESFRVVQHYGPRGLAWIFRFLYRSFDLNGCYDHPPTCSRPRFAAFMASYAVLTVLIGRKRLHLYNWQFASCQERGMRWWD